MMRRWTVAVLAPVLCSACVIGPQYRRPVAQTPAALKEMAGNDEWKMANPGDDLPKVFRDRAEEGRRLRQAVVIAARERLLAIVTNSQTAIGIVHADQHAEGSLGQSLVAQPAAESAQGLDGTLIHGARHGVHAEVDRLADLRRRIRHPGCRPDD